MTHLFICREYPPAAYPPGGIGTYVRYMTDLLARAGETVHVIAHRWAGAPRAREEQLDGRLIVHRVALDDASDDEWSRAKDDRGVSIPRGLIASSFPSQAFAWQAALLAERLVVTAGIDVIEAQEWEAPLYYFQLRRALNLGPRATPPCVVHLHSPTEQIFAANGWDTSVLDYLPAAALEASSIVMADAVLSPSRFLAEQAVARYGLDPSRVTVIPYPLGDVPHVNRTTRTWATGSLCHVGRVEPRKGVFEWVDAVAIAADGELSCQMEFIGGDVPLGVSGGPTVGHALRARIPRRLRGSFRFHGTRPRAELFEMLSNAWATVVPSRWDNLPYSCIEAMCTGLPVIASPNGGMRELIEDGVSGWIAPDATPTGLAHALKQALETTPETRARMGEAAERAVRLACANSTIVERHLDLKRRLREISAQPTRSSGRASSERRQQESHATARRGMGVVVTGPVTSSRLPACLDSLHYQTERPVAVWIASTDPQIAMAIGAHSATRVVQPQHASQESLKREIIDRMLTENPDLTAVAVLDVRVRLDPKALEACADSLEIAPRLGIVTAWIHDESGPTPVSIPPSPAEPYRGSDDRCRPFLVLRTAALQDIPESLSGVERVRDFREILDAIVTKHWQAVCYPAVLASSNSVRSAETDLARYSAMARAVQRMHTPLLDWLRTSPPRERWTLLLDGVLHPVRSVRWLVGRRLRGQHQQPSSASQPSSDEIHAEQ